MGIFSQVAVGGFLRYIPGMDWIRKLFFVALYAAMTIAWIAIFENGTTNFQENFRKELDGFVALFSDSKGAAKAK